MKQKKIAHFSDDSKAAAQKRQASLDKRRAATRIRQKRFRLRRSAVLKQHANQCAHCGWDRIPEVLELHHIDRDRSNNLLVLCPTCRQVERYLQLVPHIGFLDGFEYNWLY
jgi:hypothetical protein